MSEPIAFLGLGTLGLPMAANLLDSGYALTVYNRTAGKADPLVQRGARVAASPVDTLTSGGIVISVLWDATVTEQVVASDGFLDRLGPGGIHISMCTGSPDAARRLAALHAQHGSLFIEAPVFGRAEAVVARAVSIPFAGPQAARDRVRPILTALGGQHLFDFGEQVGAATIVKLVGNFLIISAATSMFEALTMAEKAGVDPKPVVDMLTHTLLSAPIYKNYGARIAAKAPSFSQTAIPLKDLSLFEAVARHVHQPTPIAATLLDQVRAARPDNRP